MTRTSTPADVLAERARYALLPGDCRTALGPVPDGVVQTCVTSPPYYGLRDYGTATWGGGDPACDHRKVVDPSAAVATSRLGGGKRTTGHQQEGHRVACPRCGARRVDSQIGLEQTPQEYVAQIVAVMREVRRVLRADGTLWLNLGDSYAMSTKGSSGRGAKQRSNAGTILADRSWRIPDGMKPKDILGIPWRVAFALQDDGWYLRSDVVWAKPNPMPESVTDRPTRAHEYVFLLTKRPRYFYDAEAIRERGTNRAPGNVTHKHVDARVSSRTTGLLAIGAAEARNARSVWTITPEPYEGAHFATMPPELARRCILAGSRKGDVVLDPFNGAGTSGLVALGHGRRYLGSELNPEYLALTHDRLRAVDTDAVEPVHVERADFGPLFGGVL